MKPENILLDKYGYIKLTDFGASKMLNGCSSVIGFACTLDYLAPEVLRNKKITKATDWWTFGVLIYEMLFNVSPFYDQDSKKMFQKIVLGPPSFPTNNTNISKEAIDLMTLLLKKRPNQRLGTKNEDEILGHPWFKGINYDDMYKKRLIAPITPHIEQEASVENFNQKLTKQELKMSFDVNDKC